jgi:hypothetical protein
MLTFVVIEARRMSETFFRAVRRDGKTTITFFENGQPKGVLEEVKLAETLFNITVYSALGIYEGQLLYRRPTSTSVEFVSYYKLAHVLGLVRQCSAHLNLRLH